MTTPTTNYLVLNPTTGLYQDLTEIFESRTATDPIALKTGFTYLGASGNQTDINTLFYPWSTGLSQLSYNKNMVSLTGKDLTNVFAVGTDITSLITVSGSYTYSYDATTKYYTVAFANYLSPNPLNIGNSSSAATLTFITNVSGVIFTVVAGGGGGGASSNFAGGGGGAGGDSAQLTIGTVQSGTIYNITVGAGGASGIQGGQSSVSSSTSSISSVGGLGGGTGGGGRVGQDGGAGGVGGVNGKSGGTGGGKFSTGSNTSAIRAPTNGTSQTTPISAFPGSLSCYYGGGGGGGSTTLTSALVLGGLGGGGAGTTQGTNASGFANTGVAYVGVNGISYPASTVSLTGLAATGGGGCGGNAVVPPGSQGSSGIVICCFPNI